MVKHTNFCYVIGTHNTSPLKYLVQLRQNKLFLHFPIVLGLKVHDLHPLHLHELSCKVKPQYFINTPKASFYSFWISVHNKNWHMIWKMNQINWHITRWAMFWHYKSTENVLEENQFISERISWIALLENWHFYLFSWLKL